MRTLITCAGRRHYLARFIKDSLNENDILVGADLSETAPALTVCDRVSIVPAVNDPAYLSAIKDLCAEQAVDLVFSLNDLELELLAENRDSIQRETGAIVVVPNLDAARICADKWLTVTFAQENGIPAPASFLSVKNAVESLEQKEITFPLIVKPRWGSASIGLFKAHSVDHLYAAYEECSAAVKGSYLSSLGTPDDSVIIQEAIEGPEYGVDILNGLDQEFIGFSAKRKLAMRAGETDKAVTVDPTMFHDAPEKIARALAHRGNLDCDFLERDGKFYLLEMNARFGGGYPFTHLAGANHLKQLFDRYLGVEPEAYEYSIGQAFAKYDSLVAVPAE